MSTRAAIICDNPECDKAEFLDIGVRGDVTTGPPDWVRVWTTNPNMMSPEAQAHNTDLDFCSHACAARYYTILEEGEIGDYPDIRL